MQTAEGALAPCIVNEQVGKLKVFNFQIQKTRACSVEPFDKVTNVREQSSVFHNLKLDRIFWLVEGVFSVCFGLTRELGFHILLTSLTPKAVEV